VRRSTPPAQRRPEPGALQPQQDGRGQRRRAPQAAGDGSGGRRRDYEGEAWLRPLGAGRATPLLVSRGAGHHALRGI